MIYHRFGKQTHFLANTEQMGNQVVVLFPCASLNFRKTRMSESERTCTSPLAPSSSHLFLLSVCLLSIWIHAIHASRSPRDSPTVDLSVHPSSGVSTENIELNCHIAPASSVSPLTSSTFDNVYLSVKTDDVKPSGILLMFDDRNDQCEKNRIRDVHIDVCNATLIRVRLNHTILNETLQKIDYSCIKGSARAISSYRITRK